MFAERPPRARPAATLVTVAMRQPFESSMAGLRLAASRMGFDRFQGWTESDFLRDALTRRHLEAMLRLNRSQRESVLCKGLRRWCRPYCNAFKPVALLRAMQESRAGDYVVWADSSKYADYSKVERFSSLDIKQAIWALVRRQGKYASMYGAASCRRGVCMRNGAYAQPPLPLRHFPKGNFEASALAAYNISSCSAVHGLWTLNANLILDRRPTCGAHIRGPIGPEATRSAP